MKTTIKLLTIGILFLSLYSCTKKDDNLASPVSPTPVTTSIGEMFSVSVTPVYQYITGLNIPDSTFRDIHQHNQKVHYSPAMNIRLHTDSCSSLYIVSTIETTN